MANTLEDAEAILAAGESVIKCQYSSKRAW
jgi:hypothetical protein